jgi:hypothetical protein
MNRRYERASAVLTSNQGFEERSTWAVALINRALHHCLVNILSNDFRMREHTALRQDLEVRPLQDKGRKLNIDQGGRTMQITPATDN